MTMKEIAEKANVSIATVSKVINGKDKNISDATRNNVLRIVEEYGYIPNGIAKSLRVKKSKTIGVIIPDVMNLFFSELLRGCEDSAEENGYSLIVCNSDNDLEKEIKYLNILQEKMVDGIILAVSGETVTLDIEKINVPIVIVDRDLEDGKNIGRITVTNRQGAYDATKHLIEQGGKSIAYISSKKMNKSSHERYEGYKEALIDHNFKLENNLIYLDEYSIETGYEGVKIILENDRFDSIFCGNDLIAIGAIKALRENGLKVPEDIRIVGFDDINITQFLDTPISTVHQPIYKIGFESGTLIIKMINGETVNLSKVLPTRLIVRESSR